MAENQNGKRSLLERVGPSSGALVGTVVGSYAAIQALTETPIWVQELIKAQGSDFLVAFAILGAVIGYAPRFIRSQERMAVGMNSVAETLRSLPQKDDMKFQEIIIGQGLLNDGIEDMKSRLDKIEEKVSGTKI